MTPTRLSALEAVATATRHYRDRSGGGLAALWAALDALPPPGESAVPGEPKPGGEELGCDDCDTIAPLYAGEEDRAARCRAYHRDHGEAECPHHEEAVPESPPTAGSAGKAWDVDEALAAVTNMEESALVEKEKYEAGTLRGHDARWMLDRLATIRVALEAGEREVARLTTEAAQVRGWYEEEIRGTQSLARDVAEAIWERDTARRDLAERTRERDEGLILLTEGNALLVEVDRQADRFKAERDALAAEVAPLREALHGVEWYGITVPAAPGGEFPAVTSYYCPSCGASRDKGHTENCVLKRALARPGEKGTK